MPARRPVPEPDGDGQPKAKRSRRGNNEGSIYRTADGGWEASVTMRQGVRRRLRRASYAEAVKARDQLLVERDRLLDVDRRWTVNAMLDEWLEELKIQVRSRTIRPRTWETYEAICRRYLKPELGSTRAALLTPHQYRQFQSALLVEDTRRKRPALAPAYVANIRTTLSSAYRWALAEERVPRNPVEVIRPPKIPPYEARPLTVAETIATFKAIDGHRHGPLWRFMIATGCRWQDAAGLLLVYVDLVNLLVVFVRALGRVPKEFREQDGRVWEIGEQKSLASRRIHPLASLGVMAVVQQLAVVEKLKARAGKRWQEHGLVFPSGVGTPLKNARVGEAWHQAMEDAGLPDVRLHDLRHTMVTLQRQAGTDLRTIRDLVGHASVEMTDLYAHVVPETLREAVNRVDRMLVAPEAQVGPPDDGVATETATESSERGADQET